MDTFSGFEELLDELFSPGMYIDYIYFLMLSNMKIIVISYIEFVNL